MSRTNEKTNPMTWETMMKTVADVTSWCNCGGPGGAPVEEWEMFDVFVMVGGSTPETAPTMRRFHGFMHPGCGRMTQEG